MPRGLDGHCSWQQRSGRRVIVCACGRLEWRGYGDDYGAVVVQDGGFSADVCDFGTSSGGDDNSPADVYTVLGNALSFDDDESFTCTDGLCDMGTFSFGDTTSSQSSNNVAVGVVIEATASAQLTSFGANLGGGCSTDF